MAGIFGFFDYTKPGPGVPDDAPPKAPVIVFFEVLQRKFWNLIKINLMFNIFNIPAAILGMFVLIGFFPSGISNVNENTELVQLMLKFMFLAFLMCVPMVTVGPAQAGMSYLLRNYAREEHAFIWSDFKENALRNFKQGMIISIIDFFATFIMLLSITMYPKIGVNSILVTIAQSMAAIIFVLFLMMHIYMYPMLVTFNLSIKQLYKNAFIFAAIKFFPNLLILLVCALLIFVSFVFNFYIGILIYVLFTVSLISYILNFYAYPKLKKYMMNNIEDEQNDEGQSEEEQSEEGENQ